MRNLAGLIMLHLWLLGFLYFCIATIWGTLARVTYRARSRWRSVLLPGRLKDPAEWERRQKIIAGVALPVVILVYAGMMITLLR